MNDETRPVADILSPIDLRGWLERESGDVLKAAELRIKDATDFVTRYATGEIDSEEAMSRFEKYNSRWDEALPSIGNGRQLSDREILRRIDEGSGSPKGYRGR